MEVLKTIDIMEYRAPTDTSPVTVGFQMYYDKNNKNYYHHGNTSSEIHIRIFLVDGSGDNEIIYDTNTKHPDAVKVGFSETFFEGGADMNPATASLAEAMSSIPFSPIICATKDPEGAMCLYSNVSLPTGGHAGTDGIKSILEQYRIDLSEQLGKLFLPTSGTLQMTSKFPSYCNLDDIIRYYNVEQGSQGGFKGINLDDNEFMYNINSIIPQFRTDQFSVVLNNLPIKSFKNTSDKSKSGYRKPIVALVPHPFSSADENNQMGGVIQGSYQPSYGIVNRLSNQAITTNNFDILILDLETDKPADQLTKSVINFTISAE